MTELERIVYAKSFIDKLANGINPIDDQPIAEYDVINDVKLTRCLFYVSDILRQIIENGGIVSSKKKTKASFSVTQEQISGYSYSEFPIPVSEIAKRINELIDTDGRKKLSYRKITDWLLSINALTEKSMNGKSKKHPTEKGGQIGISLETRNSAYGVYPVVVYNKEAQKFILDNIDAILKWEDK